MGAECLGVPGAAGDAEALSLLAELLSQVGLGAFTLDVGHATFLREALRKAFDRPEDRANAEAALALCPLAPDAAVLAGAAHAPLFDLPARLVPGGMVRAAAGPGTWGVLLSSRGLL